MSIILQAQEIDKLPRIDTSDIQGIQITREEVFDKESLWGYINGGADIYLEYGFEDAMVQDILWHEKSYKIDVFRMSDAEAAFGIYSVNKFKCRETDSMDLLICITSYQVLSCRGPFLISIINNSGTEEAIASSLRITNILTNKIQYHNLVLPEIFSEPVFNPYLNKLKFASGKLSVMNSYPKFIDLFESFSDYRAFILPLKVEGSNSSFSYITFNSVEDAEVFAGNVGYQIKGTTLAGVMTLDGRTIALKPLDENTIIYFESDLQDQKVQQPFLDLFEL